MRELKFLQPNTGMKAGVFSWQIWRKSYGSIVFLRGWTFFDKIWALLQCYFLMDVFYKILAWEQWFSLKNRKLRASYWLFGSKLSVVLPEMTISWPIMGLTEELFHKKFEKKTRWENNVFQRMEVILTLYGLESSVFLRE